MTEDADHLPFIRKLGYGIGDFGLVLTWQMVGLFLLYFLTDVVGLNPAVAGAIIFGGLIWDGLIDISMGAVADRTRARLGGYRSWLLIGAPMLGFSLVFVFQPPPLQGMPLILAILAIQLLFRLCFTIVGIPFGALSSAMTSSSEERGVLTGYRTTFATLATLAIAMSVPEFVVRFGGGDERAGYRAAATIVGAVATLSILICYFTSRERTLDREDGHSTYLFKDLFHLIRANSAFLIVMGCIICQATAMAVLLAGAPYLFSYVRGAPESLGPTMGILIGGVAISVPVWTILMRRIGKCRTWIFGAAWSAIGLAATATLAQSADPIFMTALGAASFGIGAVTLTAFAMLPDTVEFGEWKTGIRVEAGLFSALVFAQKTATGLATWLIGVMLEWIGHTDATLMAGEFARLFGIAIFLIPSVLLALSIVVIWRYPITSVFHRNMLAAIANRRGSA